MIPLFNAPNFYDSEQLEREVLYFAYSISSCSIHGSVNTLCPTDIIQKLVGSKIENWEKIFVLIRNISIKLALEGKINLYCKGKLANPDEVKGSYRIGLPRSD